MRRLRVIGQISAGSSIPPAGTKLMPHGEGARSTSRLTGGSLVAIMLIFGFMTIVVVAILLGALTVTIGVVLLVVPAAVIARLAKTRRPRR
jgi:hypothetical protein